MWELLSDANAITLLLSVVAWALAFFGLRLFARMFFPSAYIPLTRAERVEWDSTAFAALHGLVGFLLALAAVWDYFPGVPPDAFVTSTPFQRLALQFTLGFMAVDSVVMVVYWDIVGGLAFAIHHAIFPFTYGLGLYGLSPAFGVYTMCVLQLCEVSTPFLHARTLLRLSGVPPSALSRQAADVLFLLTFVSARIVMAPAMVWRMFSIGFGTPFPASGAGVPACDVPGAWWRCCVTIYCGYLFLALQGFFFLLILRSVWDMARTKVPKDA